MPHPVGHEASLPRSFSFTSRMNLPFLIFLCISSQTVNAIRRHPLDFSHDPGSRSADDYHETISYNNENTVEAAEHLVESLIRQNRRAQPDSGGQELPTSFDHIVTSLPYLAEGAFSTPHYAGHIPGACDEH